AVDSRDFPTGALRFKTRKIKGVRLKILQICKFMRSSMIAASPTPLCALRASSHGALPRPSMALLLTTAASYGSVRVEWPDVRLCAARGDSPAARQPAARRYRVADSHRGSRQRRRKTGA